MFDFNKKFTKTTLQEFADLLIEMSETNLTEVIQKIMDDNKEQDSEYS
jgi:hypothetical protein